MKVYLAGGLHTDWRDSVRKGAPQHQYYNPGKQSSQQSISHYVPDDLKAIDWCDLVFAYKREEQSRYSGLSAEMGYAYAKGKPSILTFEGLEIDGFIAGLAKRLYLSLDSAIEWLGKQDA